MYHAFHNIAQHCILHTSVSRQGLKSLLVSEQLVDYPTSVWARSMSQITMEELLKGQEALSLELNQLKNQFRRNLDISSVLLSYPMPHSQLLPQQWNYAQQGQRKPKKLERQMDHIYMSHSQLLPLLLMNSLVQLKESGPPPTPLPQDYDANFRCVYHSRALRYLNEDCRALK